MSCLRQRRVLVIGRGVVCGFGASEEELWRGLLSNQSAISDCPELALSGTAVPRAARAPLVAAAEERCRALTLAAARQLDLGDHLVPRRRVGVCLGTTQGELRRWEAEQVALDKDPTCRLSEPRLSDPTRALAEELGADGPVVTLSMACASGTAAIGEAASWISEGRCELVVAGGVDVLSPMIYGGFSALRALDPDRPRPFDARRAGLGVGEGAALLLLGAAEQDQPPPAHTVEILGFGLSSDAHHLTGPDPEGRGLARAIEAALQQAAVSSDEVDAVNAHGTGTVFNDLMEAKALQRAFGPRAAALPVNSIKGAIGHCMAAAGAIEAVLCAGVLERGLLPATCGLSERDSSIPLEGLVMGEARPGDYRTVLSTSSGFGGINAALLLGLT